MTKTLMRRLSQNRAGATSIEYGLIAALMAVAIIAVLTAFGPSMKAAFQNMGTSMAQPEDVTAGG